MPAALATMRSAPLSFIIFTNIRRAATSGRSPRRAGRSGSHRAWRSSRSGLPAGIGRFVIRPDAAQRSDMLAGALGEAARARTIAAYRAYRLSATKALRGEAEASLPPPLLDACDDCHSARRAGLAMTAEAHSKMAEESERLAADSVDLEKARRRLGGDRRDRHWTEARDGCSARRVWRDTGLVTKGRAGLVSSAS